MSSQIDLKSLWDKMTPRQRTKYADRFKTLDAAHIDSYDFGTPSLKPVPSAPSVPSQPSVKKDDKKDDDSKDKKKGELSDKDIEKDFKSFLSNLPKTYSDRVKTVNLDKLDQPTMDKAKMIKAGDLYYKTNDIDQAKSYLEQNNLDYKIDENLSTTDHLVLVNNQDATDVKIATRGTDLRNTDDLRADVDVLMGRQNENSTFKVAKEFAQKVKAAYPEAEVIDALGFSLGGAKSIHMSNEVPGVKSTTFNPYVVHESADTGNHTIFRTKDDLPSFMSGSLRDKGNIKINTVNSLDPDSYFQKIHHDLKNFFSNKPETDSSGEPKRERLTTPVEPQPEDTEDISSEFVDTSLSDDPMFQDPRGLPTSGDNFQGLDGDVGTEQSKPKQFDQKAFEKYRDDFRDNFGLDEEQLSDEGLEQMYRDSLAENTSGDSPSPPPTGEVDSDIRPVGNPSEAAEVRAQQHHMAKIQRFAQADTLLNDVLPNIDDGLSYSEHVHKVNGGRGIDTLVTPEGEIKLNPETGRMARHSVFHQLWDQAGGDFTDEEEEYFNKFATTDSDIGQDSLLTDSEIGNMKADGGLEGDTYANIQKESFDAVDAMSSDIQSPPADYLHVTSEGSEFRPEPQAGGPSLAHGLTSGGAGMLASTLVDYGLQNTEFGKNLSVPQKTAISSSVGGVVGEAAFSRLATGSALSGAGIGVAGLSGLGIAGSSAAVGALTTYGTEIGVDSGLKALGVQNKDVRDITKDEVGNVAGALATVSSATLAGMALGVPLDGVTFGGASLVAGGLGAIIGLGQYAEDKTHFVEKGWKAFKSIF